MKELNDTHLDFKQQKLCTPCWNGMHWHYEIVTDSKGRKRRSSNKISDCMVGDCECHCQQLLTEKHPKVKPDYSDQYLIEDVIQEAAVENHRDE